MPDSSYLAVLEPQHGFSEPLDRLRTQVHQMLSSLSVRLYIYTDIPDCKFKMSVNQEGKHLPLDDRLITAWAELEGTSKGYLIQSLTSSKADSNLHQVTEGLIQSTF